MATSKSTKLGFVWFAAFAFMILGGMFVTDLFLIDDHTKLNADGTPRTWGHAVNMWVGIPLLVAGAGAFLYISQVYSRQKRGKA